jgi:hypothetical protein
VSARRTFATDTPPTQGLILRPFFTPPGMLQSVGDRSSCLGALMLSPLSLLLASIDEGSTRCVAWSTHLRLAAGSDPRRAWHFPRRHNIWK